MNTWSQAGDTVGEAVKPSAEGAQLVTEGYWKLAFEDYILPYISTDPSFCFLISLDSRSLVPYFGHNSLH